MKRIKLESILIIILIQCINCADKPSDSEDFADISDAQTGSVLDPTTGDETGDEEDNFDVTETTGEKECKSEEPEQERTDELSINLEDEKYILDITKKKSKYYNFFKKKEQIYTTKEDSKFLVIKSGNSVIWKSENPEVYGEKVSIKIINKDIKTMKIVMNDGSKMEFFKVEVLHPWEKITANGNEQYILDIENKKGNDDYDVVKEKQICKYTVKEHYKFICVKCSGKVIWTTHNPNVFGTEVIVEGSGLGKTTIKICLNTGIKIIFEKLFMFIPWKDISTSIVNDFELDIEDIKESEYYDVVGDRKKCKYRARKNYKFTIVKSDDVVIWATRDPEIYGIEVIKKGTSSQKQNITIHLNDGNSLKFYKSLDYEIWENCTAGDKNEIRIYAESDEENGIIDVMSSSEYSVTKIDGCRFEFEFHVADCKKISFGKTPLWVHKRRKPFPLFMIYNKQTSKVTLRFERSLFVSTLIDGEWKSEGIELEDIRLYTDDEYGYCGDYTELTANKSSVELIKPNKVQFLLKKRAKCTMINVEERTVWKLQDNQGQPSSITYDKRNNIVNINFEDNYLNYILKDDEWKLTVHNLVKHLKLYTENGVNAIKPIENEKYKIIDSSENKYLIKLYEGSNCTKVKCNEMTIWKRKEGENYPICIDYEYNVRNKKMILEFDTYFTTNRVEGYKWIQDTQDIPIIELEFFGEYESSIQLGLDDFDVESTPEKSYKHQIKKGLKCVKIKVFGRPIWEKSDADSHPISITVIGTKKIIVDFGDYKLKFRRTECKYKLIDVKSLKGSEKY